MTDCLLIGHNDGKFDDLVITLKAMGEDHPDYRDLNINFIEFHGKAFRALDILDELYHEGCSENYKRYHNADLLWNTIMYLGTYLSKNKLTFDYINLFQLEKDKLKEKLINNQYLFIAITTTVYTMVDPILEVISFIKKYNNTSKIIVGGPFIAKQAEKNDDVNLQLVFKLINADFYVLNREGELALSNIIHAVKNGSDFRSVNNIAYRNGINYLLTESERENNSLEDNMIDYSLFSKDDIGNSINIRISKGCPYSCSYCGFPLRAEKYSYLEVDKIVEDLDRIEKIGSVKNLFFMDDSVNVPKSRFKELMKAMALRDYEFSWNCFLRCDQCDEETIQLMKMAKCEGVFLGLESSDDQLLKNMNKTSKKEHFEKTIPLFRELGMTVFVSIFTGFPGETYETFWNTIEIIKEMEVDFYRPQLWYCDPVTPIWQQRRKFGLKGYNFAWSHDTMDVKTACDLNDWAFLYLDDPVWSPDPGFNFISIYYLKHRGMTIEQIKTFLICYNAVVKQKLIYPNRKVTDPYLIEALKKSCQYNRHEKIDMSYVDQYSGKNYKKTEKYLLKEFYTKSEAERIGRLRYVSLPSTKQISKKDNMCLEIEKYTTERLKGLYGTDLSNILMLACSIVLCKITGNRDLKVLAGSNKYELIPLRINVPSNITIKKLFYKIISSMEKAVQYQIFALHILVNSMEYDDSSLRFNFGFLFSNGLINPEYLVKYHSKIFNDLDFIINALDDGSVKLYIQYSSDIYNVDFVDYYCSCLLNILNELSEQESINIDDISMVQRKTNSLIDALSKEFNF